MKRLLRTLVFCLVVLSISACASNCAKDENASRVPIDQKRAKPLIAALTSYYRDRGQFPAELSVLKPGYLLEIPKTTDDEDFAYRLTDIDGGYYLCFNYGQGPNCCYIPRLSGWDCSPAGAGKD